VVLGLIVINLGFFSVHGVVSGWVAALAQPYRATGQASAIYLVVYYLGSRCAAGGRNTPGPGRVVGCRPVHRRA
jgi:hypothetical protein